MYVPTAGRRLSSGLTIFGCCSMCAFLVLGPAGRDWAVKRIVFQVARECACQILYQLCEKPIALSSSLFTAAITDSHQMTHTSRHMLTQSNFRSRREMRRKHREALWIFGADTARNY